MIRTETKRKKCQKVLIDAARVRRGLTPPCSEGRFAVINKLVITGAGHNSTPFLFNR